MVEYNETSAIDGTKDVDLSLFYDVTSKVKEYTLNEDKTILTITDENSTFDIPVNLVYPTYTIQKDITIDTYVGYDINEFVTADEGVEITSTIDEENSKLNITLTKNNWSVTETKDVTLTNSSPYPMKFVSRYGWNGVILPFDGILTYTFLSPTEVEAWSYYIGEYPTTVESDTLVDEWEACKFKIEGDVRYYCIDGLGRGAERNVPGSYYYFERVYE